jgi:hypothetical protein
MPAPDEKCPTCGASGFVDNDPCPDCYGQGITPIRYDYARIYKKFDEIKADTVTLLDDVQTCKRRLKKIMDKLEIGD